MLSEKKFINTTIFAQAVKRIARIPRTPLSAADYLSLLRQKGEATCEQRIQFLLTQPNWEPVVDLFSLQGGLIQPTSGIIKKNSGERCNWNIESLFQAYQGPSLSFESPGNNLSTTKVTEIVRDSLHRLNAYAEKGCNALTYYQYEPIRKAFYTTSIPIKIYESSLTLVAQNKAGLKRIK